MANYDVIIIGAGPCGLFADDDHIGFMGLGRHGLMSNLGRDQ